MHVNNINDIVCAIKNYSLQFTYMLLSQYEFLYSSLVITNSHSGVLGVNAVVCIFFAVASKRRTTVIKHIL